MKKLVVVVLLCCTVPGLSIAQQEGIGIGAQIGDPTGVSIRIPHAESRSLNFTAAWTFRERSYLTLQADYVFYDYDIVKPEDLEGELPLYYGLGVHTEFEAENQLGVRVPVGLAYLFAEVPLDLFFEIAPVVTLFPRTGFTFQGGLGIHYYF
ncbi:MAG TPA: hypothetical protein VKA68_14550 [bacterium]|nr:hypothetical protein [bacterium]